MSRLVLITGGAGFIGSHLADLLLAQGDRVRVLDDLSHQVHGMGGERPEYLDPAVELQVADIRDGPAVRRALRDVDAVFHFAARVGVGQSMYEVAEYTGVNDLGTAVLLEALIERPVSRLVVASSMSLYGEGLYQGSDGLLHTEAARPRAQLEAGIWEILDSRGEVLTPIPTPETKPPSLASIYALSKFQQERLSLLIGQAYGIPTVALRFFNVYGDRQALSNPYTGVLAIFASRLLNDRGPMIFEDGGQRRDFVSVRDVTQACLLALETPGAAGQVFNIGSGASYTVREVADRMALALGKEYLRPEVPGVHRIGDIRHCFADITLARQVLGYEPRVTLENGLLELVGWLEGQVALDRVGAASAELAARGLTI